MRLSFAAVATTVADKNTEQNQIRIIPCLKVVEIGRPCCNRVGPSLSCNAPYLNSGRPLDEQRSDEAGSLDSRSSVVRSLLPTHTQFHESKWSATTLLQQHETTTQPAAAG